MAAAFFLIVNGYVHESVHATSGHGKKFRHIWITLMQVFMLDMNVFESVQDLWIPPQHKMCGFGPIMVKTSGKTFCCDVRISSIQTPPVFKLVSCMGMRLKPKLNP